MDMELTPWKHSFYESVTPAQPKHRTGEFVFYRSIKTDQLTRRLEEVHGKRGDYDIYPVIATNDIHQMQSVTICLSYDSQCKECEERRTCPIAKMRRKA